MDPSTLESLLLREIRKSSEISRRDLADRLEVARSTAGRRVDSLIERGLLREKGLEERSGAGRPKRFLDLVGEHGCFLGIDFDARYLYVALVDFAQNAISEKRISLGKCPTRKTVLFALQDTILEHHAKAPAPVLGYGIGVPGRVEQESRTALGYPYIRDWENVDLCSALELTPDRLCIENNTRTIALGEYWLGNPDTVENLVCLSIRTGISAAIISDGKLLRGRHETAGEIRGWNVLRADSDDRAWLEDTATVRSIRMANETTAEEWESFVTACQEGEARELGVLQKIVFLHADTVTRLVQLSDPELVVIAGAFNEIGETYFNLLRQKCSDFLTDHYFPAPEIKPVNREAFAGAYGAAALAAQNFVPGEA